jgi:hypothetical protein
MPQWLVACEARGGLPMMAYTVDTLVDDRTVNHSPLHAHTTPTHVQEVPSSWEEPVDLF